MNRPHEFGELQPAAVACADYIITLLRQSVEDRGRATLAISGGKSPALLFDEMRPKDFPWDKVHVFFVDERAVPPEDAESNYRLANEHLFAPLNFPRENIHRIEGELEPVYAAKLYSQAIRTAFGLGEGQLPVFDLIQHGMGPDGHTASLFPCEKLIADRSGIAAAIEGTKPPKDRITLLPGVLLASRASVFFVSGADKREALQQVLTGPYDPMRYPSQLFGQGVKEVDWFVAGIPGIIWP